MNKHQIPAEQIDLGDRLVNADDTLTLPVTKVDPADGHIIVTVENPGQKLKPYEFKRGELVWIVEPTLRVVPDAEGEDEDEHKADPDGLNDQRAEWGAIAVTAVANETGLVRDMGVADFWTAAIGDTLRYLHHLADREGIDFDELAEASERGYEEETTPFD